MGDVRWVRVGRGRRLGREASATFIPVHTVLSGALAVRPGAQPRRQKEASCLFPFKAQTALSRLQVLRNHEATPP